MVYNGDRNLVLPWAAVGPESYELARGVWHKITVEVRLNNAGFADGSIRLYVDDQLVGENTQVEIREKNDYLINRLSFGGWYSNSAGGANPSLSPAAPTSLLIDDISVTSTPEPSSLGDVNQNGVVDFLDIAPFIGLLASNTFLLEADCNEDGVIDFLDIAFFIQILAGG